MTEKIVKELADIMAEGAKRAEAEGFDPNDFILEVCRRLNDAFEMP